MKFPLVAATTVSSRGRAPSDFYGPEIGRKPPGFQRRETCRYTGRVEEGHRYISDIYS